MEIEPNVLGRIQRLAFRRSGERHRRAQARSASMHRWGRPTQRKKTQPSTSNIGEADRRCTQFEYGQRGPHGPRESESRHPVTNPGLSDLSATAPSEIASVCATARNGAAASWTNADHRMSPFADDGCTLSGVSPGSQAGSLRPARCRARKRRGRRCLKNPRARRVSGTLNCETAKWD